MSLFHFGLAPGGVLFLGASETPGALADEFVSIDDHWKIYRKRRDVQLLSQIRMPLHRQMPRRPALIDLPRPHGPDPLIIETYDQLLDRFMPPGFLIDEDCALVDSFAGAEKLLKIRCRRPSSNLLDLLDDELRTVVSGAIQRAVRERAAVAYSGVRLPGGEAGPGQRCTLTAEPLVHPRTATRHVLVTFQRTLEPHESPPGTPHEPPRAEPMPVSQASREHLSTLETELAYTRETLQATIEELETSNEEMQATNEELIASNEELQSTNEELHSVNEELYTVNAEYQQKIIELKELNTDLAHLLEGTDVGTVFLDRELRIRRFTARIASVFRFQPYDIGRRISDFSHNIERPQLMDDIERVRATGAVIEDEVRDSGSVPYFLRVLPYRIGRQSDHDAEPAPIDGVVLTLTDLSALDRARAHVARLSAIVESSEDAIIGNTLGGTITTWNRGAERLFGYPAAEAIDRGLRMLAADGSELERAFDRIRRGETIEHVLWLARHRSGTAVEISTTLSPIHDRSGAIVGVSAIGRDISPVLAAQRELEQRQRRITVLLEQAEDGARHREQFIAMLSHELRNPLAAVMNATTLIGKLPDAESVARCQGVIERQARHMKRLLDDLLDVSRITRGKFQLILDDIDLRGSIEAAIESTAPLFTERGVTLEHSLPRQAMPMRGDASRLVQVVVNLLSNAANYSPRRSTVRLVVTIEGDRGVLRVIDHGVGIESELQGKIFDLFVQSEQRLDRSRGGLGVGLSLAKNIVDLHGGNIEVHSDGPDTGSDFKVSLPLAPRATLHLGSNRAGGDRSGRCRIVLVDDQADSREMLRMLLESRDHLVIDVEDGPSAIDVITREKPDVAFIDIGLPAMNGYEVAQRIRDRPALDDVMLVALTGYGAPSDISAARAAGFDEHVIKPAELAKLERILATRKPTAPD
jgi:two-component system CheB/CheR fusion protein